MCRVYPGGASSSFGETGHKAISSRIRATAFASKVMPAFDAVKFIHPGDTVAISGFASAGTPKVIIPALAERIQHTRGDGSNFTINLLTGASVSTETERLLAEVDGIAHKTSISALRCRHIASHSKLSASRTGSIRPRPEWIRPSTRVR